MARINLCLNCLENGASDFPIGPEKGSQRDPYRDTVSLCLTCIGCLVLGAFAELAKRNRTSILVKIEEENND